MVMATVIVMVMVMVMAIRNSDSSVKVCSSEGYGSITASLKLLRHAHRHARQLSIKQSD
jgi:hypothetical protein